MYWLVSAAQIRIVVLTCEKATLSYMCIIRLEKLNAIQETDNGWPKFVRVHPILDWSYQDVWTFIDSHEIPYCKLYDLGYTSLGSENLTIPNPHLQKADGTYAEARFLLDASLERAGRLKSVNP